MTAPINKRKAALTQREAAKELGFHEDFFSYLKKRNPVIYRYALIHGKGNNFTGRSHNLAYCERLKAEIGKIYYELAECRALTRFFEKNKEDLSYKSARSFIVTIKDNAFRQKDTQLPRNDGVKSCRQVVKAYRKGRGITKRDRMLIRRLYED